ncbi:hypothetical protein Clacol_010115 [Clathrus columnatus]|uniref:Uncharacterized protein n=1 Tax=Clathrus columnatus TaxID=1419009 RepID=A0AAV5AQ02_9AGAM|nr:hypothetical protein Clacol_010115 [Clathrus columnatus]
MVSFTSFIVFATAALAISAATVSKRDIDSDFLDIGNTIEKLVNDIAGLGANTANANKLIQDDLLNVSSVFASSAIRAEGHPPLSANDPVIEEIETLTVTFNTLQLIISLGILTDTIQSIEGMVAIMQSGLGPVESSAAAYFNSMLPLMPAKDEPDVLNTLFAVLGIFNVIQKDLQTVAGN